MVGEKYDRWELQNLREVYHSIEIIRWSVSIYGPFLNWDNKLISLSIRSIFKSVISRYVKLHSHEMFFLPGACSK